MKLNLMSKLRYESSMLKRNEMKWEIRCDNSTKTRTPHMKSSSRDLELLFIGPYYHLASPYVRFHTSGTGRWCFLVFFMRGPNWTAHFDSIKAIYSPIMAFDLVHYIEKLLKKRNQIKICLMNLI